MGGGTGTGAAPIIAKTARENGILTVGVVTKPFHFEGAHRMRLADAGLQELEQYVDTLIVIPNQNLFRVANEKTTFADAFSMADRVLYSGVRGVTDLMVMPGLINLDFADVRSVMGEMGKAMMGTGEAEGETRAIDAAEAAISNPLLDDASMKGAKGMLINITGGLDMTLFEVDEAAERIRKEVDSEAYIIFGSTFDESMEGRMRVSVVATGIDSGVVKQPLPEMVKLNKAVRQPEQKVVPASPAPAVQPAALQEAEETPVSTTAEPVAEWAPVVASHATSKPTSVTISIKPEKQAEQNSTVATQAETIDVANPAPASAAPKPAAQKPAVSAAPEIRKPVAMPSANASDPFIPRPPVERETGEMQKSPDPFAVAAMANGARKTETQVDAIAKTISVASAKASPEAQIEARSESETAAPKAKRLSLFERVTGTGRARQVEQNSTETATVTPHPSAESSAKPADNSESEEGGPQRELGGLTSNDRLVSAPEDEDLLDIPAFLRRQAN